MLKANERAVLLWLGGFAVLSIIVIVGARMRLPVTESDKTQGAKGATSHPAELAGTPSDRVPFIVDFPWIEPTWPGPTSEWFMQIFEPTKAEECVLPQRE